MKSLLALTLLPILKLFGSCNQAEPETYLIPSSYTGEVNILFDKENGDSKQFERSRRVYSIPSNGILLTQFQINDGYIDREYYSVDSNGNRVRLEVFKYEHNDDGTIRWIVNNKNQKGIFGDGVSGQYGGTSNPKSVKFQSFVVSDFNTLDSFYSKQYRLNFDNKIETITGLKLHLK